MVVRKTNITIPNPDISYHRVASILPVELCNGSGVCESTVRDEMNMGVGKYEHFGSETTKLTSKSQAMDFCIEDRTHLPAIESCINGMKCSFRIMPRPASVSRDYRHKRFSLRM